MLLIGLALSAAGVGHVPTPEEKAAIIRAISSQLRVPAHAHYRWYRSQPGSVYCGRFNAKGLSGRYVGFQPFVILAHKAGLLHPPAGVFLGDPDSGASIALKRMCAKAGYRLDDTP